MNKHLANNGIQNLAAFKQGTKLIFGGAIVVTIASAFVRRYDVTAFMSHAKHNGGAVARHFKQRLLARLPLGSQIFIDSDNLMDLNELA